MVEGNLDAGRSADRKHFLLEQARRSNPPPSPSAHMRWTTVPARLIRGPVLSAIRSDHQVA